MLGWIVIGIFIAVWAAMGVVGTRRGWTATVKFGGGFLVALIAMLPLTLVLRMMDGGDANSDQGQSQKQTNAVERGGDNSKGRGPSKEQTYTIEHGVALIDAGGWIDADAIQVKRARYLLNDLSEKTKQTPEQIGDKIAMARHLLMDNYGKEVKLMDILEEANKSETLASGSVKLEEYLSLYVFFHGPQ